MNIKDLSIKDMVAGKTVKFVRFRRNELIFETENGFEFPVRADEVDDAVLYAEDKAGLYVKYIKRQLKLAKEELDKEEN